MRKICVVVTNRAPYGRLKSVLKAIQEHPELELQLVVGASALDIQIDFPIAAKVQCLVDGDNHQAMTLTTGLFMTQLGGIFERLKPDVVLVHADRYEMLAPAVCASYMNIPLAHTEGGEHTGTIDEKVRYAISKLADIHFPVTENAKNVLLQMGCKNIHVVGSTALDTIKDIDLTNNRDKDYVVILHHPNTTEPEDITELVNAINYIDMHKVWVNPNVDAGSKAMLKQIHGQEVEFVKNLPPEEYARLIYNSKCLIGNTSSGIKEGAFLGVPYICIGNRQENREMGPNVHLVSYDANKIVSAIEFEMAHGKYKRDYRFGDGTAGKQIADILAKVVL